MVGHGRQAALMGVRERVGWRRVEGRGVGSGLSKRESHWRLVVIDDICKNCGRRSRGRRREVKDGGRIRVDHK